MFFQEIHNEMIRFGRRFLSALRKHNFFFPKVLNDLAQKTFYFNPTVSLPCNLAISFFSVFSLKALLRLKFSYLSSLRSRCIVAHKILDVLELWEKICIQETIFCCEEGSPMLEGDEEFLIHLVGKKQMDGLQQFWNHPWNLKLGENVFFFNGTLSQTLANNFYLKEYIELSANGHRLLLPPSKKSVLFFAFKSGSRGSTDNHYHPLLCRLDFIIQYALFRRMILIQEYRFYQSLLSSEFPSSTNPYSTGSVNGCNNEKEERREVLLCDNLREKDHASSNTRWPLWLRSLSKRNPKEEKNNKKMDALRRERDLHRMKCRTGTEAWRICGTPSWLLSRERHTQQDRTVRHRFFCLPLSYFPVESVMPHLADWLYDDVLEKMLPLWKRVAQTCLIKYSHACCSQLELWKEEEKEEKGEEWMRKRGPGGRRSRRVQMLYQGQGLAAHSAVYFWFYRYTSALLEKQLQSAEMNANRFYQDRVYDGSFRFFSSFFHFPKHIGRGEGQRCGTPQDAEENTPMREEEAAILSPTPNLPQPQQKCMDPHSTFSSLPSSPFAFSSMPMMKGRPSMVRKLLFLEGFTTCVITCLDLFSSRVFADVSILSAAMAMTGEFPFTKGEGNVYRREEAEGNGSRWRGRCADAEWKDEGDVLFSFSTKVLWSLLSSVGGVLLRGVRREITKQLSDVLSEDLEDHIASVLIAADHAFLDRLFTFEDGGSDGRPRGVVTSSSFSSGPRSSPYRFHGRGLYTPSAKGVIRRVGGAGEVLVTQWDDAIRRWATGVVLLSHAFYWRDGSSLGLAFGWAWGHHKNIVGKIAVGGGFAQDTSSWIWLREQSPPFHRTPFGLSLLLDVLSEMEGEASTTTPLLDGCSFPDKVEAATTTTTSERMSDAHGTHTTRRTAKMHRRPHLLFPALSFLVCSDVWHIPVCFLAPALSSLPREGRGQEGPEEEDDEKKKKKTQEAANDTMHASRDLFATHPAEDHRPILLPWSRGQRWLRFYTLLASPFTIPCATEQEPWWTGAMTASLLAMQEMVACIKEEVIRPAVPHRRSVPHGQNANGRWDVTEAGRGVDITEEGTMAHSSTGGTTTFPSWSPAPRVPPLVSSSATAFLLHGRQEHVYELDPEEQAMVRHPGVLENLPYAGSGALWRHFQPHSFFLLKQLGLESVMTFKAWTEKVREEAANDSFDDSGEIRGSPPDHSPTAGSSLSSWWRWWWGRLGSHTEALFAHDGTSNPFAALLRQCVEVVEVVLLAGCTCIRVRWRRRPPPSFATFAFSSVAEEDEREGKGEIATTTQGEREAGKPMRGKRGVSFSNALLRGMRMLHTFSPLSRLEWYTECTPHAASLLLMREARWTMYQRAIASALRQKSSRRHTRFLSGMYELLHYLPSTMADDSPRGRSAEMTRRRMLWRCYLSSASCPLSLRFNAQHCITGGLVLTQGIRFHDVSFLYPQLRYGMVTCGDPWRSSCASSTPLEAVEMAWETPTGEKTHTVGKKTETAQDGVHGSDGNMPLPGRGTPTTGAPISTADDTPGRTTTHPLRHADPDAMEEERCGTIQKEEGTTVYSSSLVTPILSNVTMFFPSSGMSAVIGRTGAGKSTLFHLLSRVYDPTPEVWVEWKVHTSTTPMQQSRKTKETKRDGPLCAGLSGEEEGEEGESHPSHRLPWSRELAADIVFQLFSHTIPLPPSSSSFSSTPECSHEREDYTVGITRPGYVSFDCIPAACFSLCYLRQWFLPMEQTPTILPHRTFEENIRFTHAAVRSRDVAWAAAACQCMPFIQKTPLQLQQPVHGMLSGGEQQRLGLARVFAASCARMRAYRLSHAYYHWGATVPWPSTGRPASSSLSSHPSFSSSHGALEGCPSRPKEEEEEEEASGRGNILVDASWSSLSSPTNSPSTLLVPAAENHTEVHQIKEACGAVASSAAVVPSFSTSPSALCPSSPPSLQHTVAVAGVLLDEPTSRLDAVHERKVEEAIRSLCLMPSSSSSSSTSSFSFSSPVGRRWSARQLMAGGKLLPSPAPTCMVIVIAHRLSTIQAASHIIVLEDGKVEAEGTPQNVFRTSSFARKQLLLQRVLPDRP